MVILGGAVAATTVVAAARMLVQAVAVAVVAAVMVVIEVSLRQISFKNQDICWKMRCGNSIVSFFVVKLNLFSVSNVVKMLSLRLNSQIDLIPEQSQVQS
ncbi:hypothetical protein Pfo_022615 [Paulownia fortunei]|nr:hypothetical protein Pfo_022615 [Paulownia fortunei]